MELLSLIALYAKDVNKKNYNHFFSVNFYSKNSIKKRPPRSCTPLLLTMPEAGGLVDYYITNFAQNFN